MNLFEPATAATIQTLPFDSEYQVEVVSGHEALRGLRPVWNQLVARAGIDHPFLSHEWICSWWESFGAGKTLHVLLVRVDGRVVAIAPLMRSEERVYGMRVRRLASLYNPHTPRFDFIVAYDAEGVYRHIWRYLLSVSGEWDVLELSQLLAGSRTLDSLSQLARDDGYLVGVWRGEVSPYVPFNGTWERYVDRLSRNHWAKVRKGLNRLARRGDVRLETISAGEQLSDAMNDGLRIEAAAWKEQTGTAISSNPDVEKFYRVLAERAAVAGTLRLLFLTVAGSRIAFAYALCYRNKLYVLKAGYDPAYAYYSPYNLLCYLVFQDGFARGLDEYEFLGGDEAWKLDWTQVTKGHDWLYVFAPGLRTRLLYHAKFRWIPLLQRRQLYRCVRDTIFMRGRKTARSYPAAHRDADASGGEHSPIARG